VNSVCIYTPTCSKYAEEAIKTKGIIKGIVLSLKRLARCNPKNAMAYDPVPQENKLR
tara:strand:+ start:319 stop:489 length:171 start_codon:yes stop_codon:yes gene_type:complete